MFEPCESGPRSVGLVLSVESGLDVPSTPSSCRIRESADAPSSFGPGSKFVAKSTTVCGPASSLTSTPPSIENVGWSLIGFTVTVKTCGSEVSIPPPSVPPSS